MNYDEFQVWFHVFNTVAPKIYETKQSSVLTIQEAKIIADYVSSIYSETEKPKAPEMPDLKAMNKTLENAVNSVVSKVSSSAKK